jgi:hypothetical protein
MPMQISGSRALGDAKIEETDHNTMRVTVPEYGLSFEATPDKRGQWRLSRFIVGGFNLTSTYSAPPEHNVLNHVTLAQQLTATAENGGSVREAAEAVERAQKELADAQRKLADARR